VNLDVRDQADAAATVVKGFVMSDPVGFNPMSRRSFLQSAGAGSALGALPGVSNGALFERAGDDDQAQSAAASLHAEFDEYGFVLMRELIPRELAARAEQRVRDIMSRRPDADNVDQHLPGFLNCIDPQDDELFLPLVTQPVFLALAQRLLGDRYQMTETGCRWRKPGSPAGPIHASRPIESMTRAGLPAPNVCFVLAFSWMLNDLTADRGATLYLPFSQHAPMGPRLDVQYQHLVAVEAPAGSVIVHHGGIWHHFGANTSDQDRIGLMGGFFPYWMDPVAVGWRPLKRSVRDRMPMEVQQRNRHVIDG
jgi:hypothetical protein